MSKVFKLEGAPSNLDILDRYSFLMLTMLLQAGSLSSITDSELWHWFVPTPAEFGLICSQFLIFGLFDSHSHCCSTNILGSTRIHSL